MAAATLIVNPNATSFSEPRVAALVAELRPVETLYTEDRGHAIELARAAKGDEVWVFGGDGLINEALNGLREGAPLGVVAGGHTNVLARSLGVDRRPVRGRVPRRISVGRVNGRRFAFAAGIGVDSHAVRQLDTIKRRRLGRRPGDVAYARVIATRLLRGYRRELEIEELGPAAMVFVANDAVYTYAGPRPLRVSPVARFELGLDVVAIARADAVTVARVLARLSRGRPLEGVPAIAVRHDTDGAVVRCARPLPLQADGEDLGDVTEAVFEAERDALTVLV